MAAYARQGKDSELIQYATEIKVRAERRCGELLATVDRSPGARTDSTSSKPETRYQETLRENDLHPATADRYQQLAAMPAGQWACRLARQCWRSSRSFSLASLTVCHCMFSTTSAPPAQSGWM